MRQAVETEQERTRRLDQLIRSLVAENRIDAERSAELLEALAPFAAVAVSEDVQKDLDALFCDVGVSAGATAPIVRQHRRAYVRA